MSSNLNDIISLAKRRGYIFPGSEIYGGLANTYDYGPLGTELLKNIRDWWWERFVRTRQDMFGLESSVITNPRVWQASGHTESFTDPLIECKSCHMRMRADHLIEDFGTNDKVEGKSLEKLFTIITKDRIPCPSCGKLTWTEPKKFNLLFETEVGIVSGDKSKVYLRGETAQGMFINFRSILETMRPRLPFGIAQSGKVFRNEVTPGKFTFRTLEFDLAEFEYFVRESEWEKWFTYWKEEAERWATDIGVAKSKLRWRPHSKDELSHYSKRTEDLEYEYPFGYKEWLAVAYRTDFDLSNHAKHSGVPLEYTDPDTGEKFIPHVIEPTFGLSRTLITVLIDAYINDDSRVVLALHPRLAPYKAAIFPLVRNKPELTAYARKVFTTLLAHYPVVWDDRGNIGKRYFAQDEIGTPWCVTIDYDTLVTDTVTVRDRDTAVQERVSVAKLVSYVSTKLKGGNHA